MNDRDRIDKRLLRRLRPAEQGALRTGADGGSTSGGQFNAYFEDGGSYPTVSRWFMFDVAGAGFAGPPGPYYVPVVIDHTKVAAGVTEGFPVYMSGVNLPADFWTGVGAAGADMVITEDDGETVVPFELVHFSKAGNTLELHCKPAGLSSTVDTNLRLYWGNTALTGQTTAQKQSVWSNNYQAVYHLTETGAGTGTADVYQDSTANANHGDDYVDPGGKVGQLYSTGGETFTVDDDVRIPDLLMGATQATVSCWIKRTSYLSNRAAISNYRNIATVHRRFILGYEPAKGTMRTIFGYNATTVYADKTGFPDNIWSHLAATFIGGSTTAGVITYVDGVGSAASSAATVTSLDNTAIDATMRQIGGWGAGSFISAILDEVRVSTVARTAGWMTTEVANQSSPGTFYSISPAVTVSNWTTGGRLG